jgi:hypothetical protein
MSPLMTKLTENEFKYFVEWYDNNHPKSVTNHMVESDYRNEFKKY